MYISLKGCGCQLRDPLGSPGWLGPLWAPPVLRTAPGFVRIAGVKVMPFTMDMFRYPQSNWLPQPAQPVDGGLTWLTPGSPTHSKETTTHGWNADHKTAWVKLSIERSDAQELGLEQKQNEKTFENQRGRAGRSYAKYSNLVSCEMWCFLWRDRICLDQFEST